MPGFRAECASSVTVSVVQDLQDEHEDLDVEEKGKQCRESVGQLTVRGSFVRWTALVPSRSSEHLQLTWMMSVKRQRAPKLDGKDAEERRQVSVRSAQRTGTHMYSSGETWFLCVPPTMDCVSMMR